MYVLKLICELELNVINQKHLGPEALQNNIISLIKQRGKHFILLIYLKFELNTEYRVENPEHKTWHIIRQAHTKLS